MILALLLAASGSTVAIDRQGRGTWVVDSDGDAVWLVPAKGPAQRHAVGRWPEQLEVSSDGVVFVTCRQDGRIDVLDGEQTLHIELPGEPRGLALDERAHRLWVGLVTARELVGIDTESLAVVDRRPLDASPRAVAVNAKEIAVLFERGGRLQLFDRDPQQTMGWFVKLPNFGTQLAWHGYALTVADEDFVVAHSFVDTGLSRAVSTGGYGGAVRAPVNVAVSFIHDGRANLVTFSSSVDFFAGSGKAVTGLVDVTGIAYRDSVLALSSRGNDTVFAALASRKRGRAFFSAAWQRAGAGLSGVAIDANGQLIAAAAFDRQLATLKYRSSGAMLLHAGVSTFGRPLADPELALGRALFHRGSSSDISSAGLSCATCHVDGRDDGLVWRLQLTRRQTPTLTGKLKGTEPYTWVGTARGLDESIQGTVQRLGGRGLSAKERRALAKYLSSGLRPFSRPPSDEPAEMVAQGDVLFHSDRTGCASCHPSDAAFTDGAVHDVGSYGNKEREESGGELPRLDTPSLRGIAFTAPYFHDGSVGTLDELLEANADRMGQTSALSPDERRALAAYLRTL